MHTLGSSGPYKRWNRTTVVTLLDGAADRLDASADIDGTVAGMAEAGRVAATALAVASTETKDRALRAAAAALRADCEAILAANREDLARAQQAAVTGAFLDRLGLDGARVEAMAKGLEDIAALPDPVGTVLAAWERPNGLHIERVRVPLGVIGIIYESRPNVTADAAGLCLKAGNAAILRGGSESFRSSRAIAACMRRGVAAAGLPETAVQLIPTTDRAAVGAMLRLSGLIDVIVPRGGKSLIARVSQESQVPVLAHLDGICHVYLHAAADPDMARRVTLNAKMRRTGICGAAETLLVDRAAAARLLPPVLDDLAEAGCKLRGDGATQALDSRVTAATEDDWGTEYLDAILSIRQVAGLDEAIAHIERYGSHHTESIVTEDSEAAEAFLARVDSGIVMVNASTQFADGGEFGMGAEIGISTGKLHARGPVGAAQLTSYKYKVRGAGQVRP